MSTQVGRNDPCHCGSGKKYKKCHMPLEKATTQARLRYDASAQWVRRDMLKYARDERFAEAFAAALADYWHELYTIETAEQMSEDEALRFFDWFIYDYPLPAEDGGLSRVIDRYAAERGDDLTDEQRSILEAWRAAAPAAGYVFHEADGQMLELEPFEGGERQTVYTSGGRGNLDPGDVVLARLLPYQEQLRFSTTAAYIPREEIGELAEGLAAAREAFAAAHPGADDVTVARATHTTYIHHALAEAEKAGRPPVARLNPDRSDKRTQKLVRQMRRLQR